MRLLFLSFRLLRHQPLLRAHRRGDRALHVPAADAVLLLHGSVPHPAGADLSLRVGCGEGILAPDSPEAEREPVSPASSLSRAGAAHPKHGSLRHLVGGEVPPRIRSEEHTSELQSLMRISYAVYCLQK